jgi:hypothetical protein
MAPIGPLNFRRGPEHIRRQVDVAAAAAWEALVESHTSHALRFVALMAARLDFDEAIDRYLDELDVQEPMASAVRSRVLIALEHAIRNDPDRPTLRAYGEVGHRAEGAGGGDGEERDDGADQRGLRRFRPDVLMKGIARKVRETGEIDEWVRLAVARAEEGVIRAHVDNAVIFVAVLRGHEPLHEAVDDYLELMRVSGGRAQSVHQRAMARLADLHLPDEDEDEDEDEDWDDDET